SYHFLPEQLEMTWENLEPLFRELEDREISSVAQLERWLSDRSELEAALEENFAWRYIRMTCDTADQSLLADFQYFVTEIEPKILPLNNEMNKKFIGSAYLHQLHKDTYLICIR